MHGTGGAAGGWLLWVGAILALAPLAGGWFAPLDSLAILTPYVAVSVLILALWMRGLPLWLRGSAAVAALAALVPLAQASLGHARPDTVDLRLFQHNILYSNDGRLLPQAIQGHHVATFQEVQSVWTALRTLPAPWVGLDCPEAAGIGTAVATRLPIVARGCLDGGEAWVRVAAPAGEVTVLSLHLYWPWPAGGDRQARQVAQLAPQIAKLPRPVIIGGDFNQMPWSAAVRTLAQAAGGTVTPGLRASFTLAGGALRLPIDHVIVPAGWQAETVLGPRYTSDHRSVTARIGFGS